MSSSPYKNKFGENYKGNCKQVEIMRANKEMVQFQLILLQEKHSEKTRSPPVLRFVTPLFISLAYLNRGQVQSFLETADTTRLFIFLEGKELSAVSQLEKLSLFGPFSIWQMDY